MSSQNFCGVDHEKCVYVMFACETKTGLQQAVICLCGVLPSFVYVCVCGLNTCLITIPPFVTASLPYLYVTCYQWRIQENV